VLRDGDPLVVPLDVTVLTCLDHDTLSRLVAAAPVLRAPVDRFFALQGDFGVPPEHRRVCLHDPLALVAVADPTVVDVETRTVRVERDGRLVEDLGGVRCRFATAADVPRAIELVVESVARGMG
jgi:inosine-uridine nucleoside N-ribohydrolase